jgi:DNA-binding beta-propeller fold protein YncE
MRAGAALLVLVVLAALAAGCSERPRANPFDPANPATGGRPAGFQALAGDGRVTLRWLNASAPGLVGYQVMRSLSATSGFTPISSVLPPGTGSFSDVGLLNGVDHYYRLYYVFGSGPGSLYASDVATPGPLTPWVADDGPPALYRLSNDGRHVVEYIPNAFATSASDIDVDRGSGAVWAADPLQGLLTIYQPSTGHSALVQGLGEPVAIAVDSIDHTAWVGESTAGTVEHFAPDGSLASPPSLGVFDSPIGLAIDPNDRSVWVCERTGSRVRHVDRSGAPLSTSYVINPSRVAVDSVTRDAWVTSFSHGLIVHLTAAGVRSDSLATITGPVGIVVDGPRGSIWVTDPVAGTVTALTTGGAIKSKTSGLAGAYDLALDPRTGEVWVAAEDAAAVVRISPAGVPLRVLGGFAVPDAIALDTGSGAVAAPAGALRAPPDLAQRTITTRAASARPAWVTRAK